MSSHVFNAKSCPLRFSRNLRKALRQVRHIHARRRRKGKRNLTNLHISTPLDTYFSMSHSQVFQNQGIPFHTKQMPSFRMSRSSGSIVRVSPFRYRSSLGSSTERESQLQLHFSGKPVQAAEPVQTVFLQISR